MQMCYFVFISLQTSVSLCVCSNFQRNIVNGGSKDQKCLLVEYGTV